MSSPTPQQRRTVVWPPPPQYQRHPWLMAYALAVLVALFSVCVLIALNNSQPTRKGGAQCPSAASCPPTP